MPHSESKHPVLGIEITKPRKHFQHPLLTSKSTIMAHSTQTTISNNYQKLVPMYQRNITFYIKFDSCSQPLLAWPISFYRVLFYT